ncbi:hypothetical protein SEUCBS140593_000756 [Sporothrix eucalyptigena]|uniref:Uncharacterized protein n=1 Tax=Sporothrix eucalyptigena TaxID=1812306 RepID=A0ABP0ASG1_9PEZI
MASYPTAEDEKRLLAHATETTTVLAADDSKKTKCRHACKRRVASIKKVAHFTVTLIFVLACCVAFFGLSSLAIGTVRHARAKACNKHTTAAGAATVPVVVVAAADAAPAQATGTGSGFSRLLEAVSPESLHDLLHEYFPDTYKHGVYPSEKKAMEAIHRANAALATSIVQLARRDLNGTVTSSSTSSAAPTSSTPATSSTFKNSSTSSTSSRTTKTSSSSSSTITGKKTTSVDIYTSTINGSPTVVTATTVVGVGASNTGATTTNSGTLQTGAAVPLLGSQNKVLAVAGAVAGAMLI